MYTKKNKIPFLKHHAKALSRSSSLLVPPVIEYEASRLKTKANSEHKSLFDTIQNTRVNKTKKFTTVSMLPFQEALYKINSIKAQVHYKAKLVQLLLLLTNLKKKNNFFTKLTNKNNVQLLTKFNKYSIQQTLKPTSTVTGFKKFMYNFVKLNQNQLQPSYNRRKYSHSHSNQTLKESTRLSRIYSYLSKPQIQSYCAFALKSENKDKVFAKKKAFTLCNNKIGTQVAEVKIAAKQRQLQLKSTKQSFVQNIKSNQLNFKTFVLTDKLARGVRLATFFRPIPKLVTFLESRLDVILWRNQLANSIGGARQKLRQGIQVNGSSQKKASFQTLPGDVFTL